MLTRHHLRSLAIALGILFLGLGCSRSDQPAPGAGASVQEFQKYYSSRRWYWVEPVAELPANIPDYDQGPGRHRLQVRLVSRDQQREILYMEIAPSRRRVAFRAWETPLQKLDGVEAPLFGVAGDTNVFFGFFEGGACRLQVIRWGEDPARTRRELYALGAQITLPNRQRQ